MFKRMATLLVGVLAALALTALPAAAATGQITGYGGKCVDVAAANSANGTKVQIYACNGSVAQQWTIGADGTIRALGKCLDATGPSSADGTPLQIWDCTGGANQQWTIPI